MHIQESVLTKINRAINELRIHSLSPSLLDEDTIYLTKKEYYEFFYYVNILIQALQQQNIRNPVISYIKIYEHQITDRRLLNDQEKLSMLSNYKEDTSPYTNSGLYLITYKDFKLEEASE